MNTIKGFLRKTARLGPPPSTIRYGMVPFLEKLFSFESIEFMHLLCIPSHVQQLCSWSVSEIYDISFEFWKKKFPRIQKLKTRRNLPRNSVRKNFPPSFIILKAPILSFMSALAHNFLSKPKPTSSPHYIELLLPFNNEALYPRHRRRFRLR